MKVLAWFLLCYAYTKVTKPLRLQKNWLFLQNITVLQEKRNGVAKHCVSLATQLDDMHWSRKESQQNF